MAPIPVFGFDRVSRKQNLGSLAPTSIPNSGATTRQGPTIVIGGHGGEFYYVRRQGGNACRRIHGKPTGALQIHSRVSTKFNTTTKIIEFLFLVTNEYFRFSVNKVLACKNEDNCVTNLHLHNFYRPRPIVLNLIYTWYSIAK